MGRKRLYASATARKRAQRAREKAARAHQLDARPAVVAVVDHADPVGELARWASEHLIVPAGHPRAGEPMALADWAVSWMRETWTAYEAALSTARKNAKSAICAIEALGFLVGPLRRPGWRGAIASVSKEKAGELRTQVREIAEASHLAGIRIRRSPYPGVIESSTGSLDTLSADRLAGHSAGYDRVWVDETGLFPLRARDLLAGLRSSVSARAGKIRHISIRGDSELFAEILNNPAVPSHVYAAPEDCAIDDAAAWGAANPGLGTIKSIAYMRSEVERVQGVASDEPSFRALDLNLAVSPSREMVCSPDDLRACFADEVDYRGAAYVGLDIGEAGSGTAAAAYWPRTGALRTWLAFGASPDLKTRGKRDGADYLAMARHGELRTYPGRVVPVAAFVADVRADLAGATVRAAVADEYKSAELRDVTPWPLTIVRTGAGPDGSAAVRAFQRVVLTKSLQLPPNLSLASAIKESTLRRGGTGMPAVDRARSCGRIDVLSAAVLAVGAAAKPRTRSGVIRSALCEATA